VALLFVTILWGCTFVWMKQALDAAERALGRPAGLAVIAFYIAVRFSVAAGVLALWPRARAGLDRGAWRGGGILGGILFVGFVLQMRGLSGVTPSVSAFLTSLYVVFAALLTFWMHRHRPHAPFLVGALLATLGAGFIEGPPNLTFGSAEWLTIASAAIFAVHILATDRLTKVNPPLAVSLAMFVCMAAFAILALPVALRHPQAPAFKELLALFDHAAFVIPLSFTTLFATLVALTLMNLYQRELDPLRAAILYALEPIWTTLFAFVIGFGRPGFWLWVGGGALVAGNLIAEWGAARDEGSERP